MLGAHFYLLSALSLGCAAQMAYRRPQAYYYNAPAVGNTAVLQRIVAGHVQRFQSAERQHEQATYATQYAYQTPVTVRQLKPQAQHRRQQRYQIVSAAPHASSASQVFHSYALPLNTPVPKNYAQNFLPTDIDVVPGSSYIPFRLLRLKR